MSQGRGDLGPGSYSLLWFLHSKLRFKRQRLSLQISEFLYMEVFLRIYENMKNNLGNLQKLVKSSSSSNQGTYRAHCVPCIRRQRLLLTLLNQIFSHSSSLTDDAINH